MLTLNFRDLNKKLTYGIPQALPHWLIHSAFFWLIMNKITGMNVAERTGHFLWCHIQPLIRSYPLPLLANGELYSHLQHLVTCTVSHSSWQILLCCASQSVSGSNSCTSQFFFVHWIFRVIPWLYVLNIGTYTILHWIKSTSKYNNSPKIETWSWCTTISTGFDVWICLKLAT